MAAIFPFEGDNFLNLLSYVMIQVIGDCLPVSVSISEATKRLFHKILPVEVRIADVAGEVGRHVVMKRENNDRRLRAFRSPQPISRTSIRKKGRSVIHRQASSRIANSRL